MTIKPTLASALIAACFMAAPVMASSHDTPPPASPATEDTAPMQTPTPAQAQTQTPAIPATTADQPAAAALGLGVTADISTSAAQGWSVKNALIGQNVYNDSAESENVGDISDVILDREGSLSYAVVNASRFLGLSSHHVLIPIEQFRFEGERIVLPGSTNEALRELPEFDYAD